MAPRFLSKKVWTLLGPVQVYILFFIHVGSRRVHVAGMTTNPNAEWMAQQARNMAMVFDEQSHAPTHLIRDLDGNHTPQFDFIMADEGIEVVPVGPRAPNLNAFAERWVLSLRSECLDHFICFGEEHLRYIISEYVHYYHACRPHQGLGNRPLSEADPQSENPEGEIECVSHWGGLLNHYQPKAA